MEKFKPWLLASSARAVKTMAQAMIAVIGTSSLLSQVDIKMVLSTAILAGILSMLTSIAGLPELKEE